MASFFFVNYFLFALKFLDKFIFVNYISFALKILGKFILSITFCL